MTSVSSFSQDLQKVTNKGKKGLFITFSLMDSVSLKLIDRNSLRAQILAFSNTIEVMKKENRELASKFELSNGNSKLYKSLFDTAERQRFLYQKSFENQEIITKNNKRKSRKNMLYFFGSGVAVGVVIFAVLLN